MTAIDPSADTILITGAAGALGSAVRARLNGWEHLRLTDQVDVTDLSPGEEFIRADIRDPGQVEQVVKGSSALIHLAGVSGPYSVHDLVETNVIGLLNVLEIARANGVTRIVFASTNHVFGCYPVSEHVDPSWIPRPDSLYGAFKVLGETVLRTYYDQLGIESVSIRIGTCRQAPIDQRSLATWLSFDDLAQIVESSLRHPEPGCLVINGYSDNTRLPVSKSGWDMLGYSPRDNAEDHISALRSAGVDVDGPLKWFHHGGARRGGAVRDVY
jgi:uronate dehydrogenase